MPCRQNQLMPSVLTSKGFLPKSEALNGKPIDSQILGRAALPDICTVLFQVPKTKERNSWFNPPSA